MVSGRAIAAALGERDQAVAQRPARIAPVGDAVDRRLVGAHRRPDGGFRHAVGLQAGNGVGWGHAAIMPSGIMLSIPRGIIYAGTLD